MKKLLLFIIAICLAVLSWSCTKDKTDYKTEIDAVAPEYHEFKEALAIQNEEYHIRIEALNGTFYTGYNEIRLKVTDNQTSKKVHVSAVTFLPMMTDSSGNQISCPHRYNLEYEANEDYFSGYAVFTNESQPNSSWELYITFRVADQTHTVKRSLNIHKQVNKNLNMTSFTAKDNEQYYIALISPQKPKVGENELVAGIYKFNRPTHTASGNFPDPSQFSYTEIRGYTVQLDPRMPEPSMGNHSSPNNKDLTQNSDGHYRGLVNYTMTGNWTLNLILLDPQGHILKGTRVPTDFTPGVEGAKSELFIDILF